MHDPDPMKRVFNLAKLNHALSGFKHQTKLSKFETRLLKGFYVSNKTELAEEKNQRSEAFFMNTTAFFRKGKTLRFKQSDATKRESKLIAQTENDSSYVFSSGMEENLVPSNIGSVTNEFSIDQSQRDQDNPGIPFNYFKE